MNAGHLRMNQPWFSGSMAAAPRHINHPGMMHPHHHPHYHGFCHSCCHPVSKCVCGYRECRKEAKELLVIPGQVDLGKMKEARVLQALRFMAVAEQPAEEVTSEEVQDESPDLKMVSID